MSIFKRLYNVTTPGKGVKKKKMTDKERFGLRNFFVIYKEKFWHLITLNFIYILINLPLFFPLLAFSGMFSTPVQAPLNGMIFEPLYGAMLYSPTPEISAIFGIFGSQATIHVNNPTVTTLYMLSALLLLTFGIANTGMTYVLRGFVRGDHMSVWRDFFYGVKTNLFRGIIMGFFDLGIMVLMVFSAHFYNANFNEGMNALFFFTSFGFIVIYFFMRFYIYLMLITFRIKPARLIKNALIFVMLCIKRNLAAFIGIVLFIALNGVLLSIPFFTAVGLVMPFILAFSTCSFMAAHAAYAGIKKYMIDPYYDEHPEEIPGERIEIIEPIFTDRG